MGSPYCYNCRYSCTSSVDELVGCKWEVCIATIVDTVAQVQWMNWWVVNGKSVLLQL